MGDSADRQAIGVVVIGRNEGERLQRCLRSLVGANRKIVYVDSGSSDDSTRLARSLGVTVVDLDMGSPFTAARARNAGFDALLAMAADVQLVQFVDGDCEVIDGWLDEGAKQLESGDGLAAVCGRVRERYPERSVYNRLCDMEWDAPLGEVNACGGNAMYRVGAYREVGGFNPALIAGEEADLCLRLRRKGWKILRVDAEMVLHDANLLSISQWWQRTMRAGHAYAQGADLHRGGGEQHNQRNVRSIVFWGLALPVLIATASALTPLALPLVLVYPLQMQRVARGMAARFPTGHAQLYGCFCVLGKFPEAVGVAKYHLNRATGRQTALIEHK